MTLSVDLEARLVMARDVVQTLAAGLRLLTDDDLLRLPSSTTWQPRVATSPEPPVLWTHDTRLANNILAALRQAHMAALALCALDIVDDPAPWDEAPDPGDPDAPAWPGPDHVRGTDARHALPGLAEVAAHLAHLDGALAQVQQRGHELGLDDVESAIRACDLLADGEVAHPRWRHMARRARYECAQCGRLAGRAELCQVCTRQQRPCAGTPQRECRRLIPAEHSRCGACRTALHRERSAS